MPINFKNRKDDHWTEKRIEVTGLSEELESVEIGVEEIWKPWLSIKKCSVHGKAIHLNFYSEDPFSGTPAVCIKCVNSLNRTIESLDILNYSTPEKQIKMIQDLIDKIEKFKRTEGK